MSDDARNSASDGANLPALTRQVSELVLAGSLGHAEEAFSQAADEHGDYAVTEVLATLPPQVTALHLAGFDGGKTSLATLLVPPKAWADSLAYMAATWPDNMIEDDPSAMRSGSSSIGVGSTDSGTSATGSCRFVRSTCFRKRLRSVVKR